MLKFSQIWPSIFKAQVKEVAHVLPSSLRVLASLKSEDQRWLKMSVLSFSTQPK